MDVDRWMMDVDVGDYSTVEYQVLYMFKNEVKKSLFDLHDL